MSYLQAQRHSAPLRVAIIGAGWIARRHVPAIEATEGAELVAACDSDIERAQAIAAPRGGNAYEDWRHMLAREDLDAVWVCTPPLLHREPTISALECGIHVYLEKPLARTVADGEAIAEAADGGDAICMVGYQWHASELVDDIRAVTNSHTIGMLIGRNYGPVAGRPWFVDATQGGGQVLERGSHHIDLQRAIAGEIDAVEAVAGSRSLAPSDGRRGDIDDVLALTLQFRSGALGAVNVAWSPDGQPGLYALDVIASDASIWVGLGPGDFKLRGFAAGRQLEATYRDPFERSIHRFIEVVRSGDRRRVFCTPTDALQTLKVALACERALADCRRVAVPR